MKGRAFASLVALGLLTASFPAAAQKGGDTGLLPGGASKEPISVDAGQLVYDDKANTATYSGNVVVIQGTTKLTCFANDDPLRKGGCDRDRRRGREAGPLTAQERRRALVRLLLRAHGCDRAGDRGFGKPRSRPGDNATFDQTERKVWLTGHVTLSDGTNVTKGSKLVDPRRRDARRSIAIRTNACTVTRTCRPDRAPASAAGEAAPKQ